MKKLAVLMMMLVFACGMVFADDSGFQPAGDTGAKPAAAAAKPAAAAVKAADSAAAIPADQATGEVTVTEGETVDETQKKQESPGFGNMIWIFAGVMILMLFLSSRAKKKQQKQRQDLLSSLKKGDKVVTIGGICGTIAEARDNELIVKVDDNMRLKFARWAVRAAGEEADADKSKDQQEEK